MTIYTTGVRAQAELAQYLDAVTRDREVVIIQRRGEEDAALIAASELQSLTETAFLLRSPANAERLLSALLRAVRQIVKPNNSTPFSFYIPANRRDNLVYNQTNSPD